MWTKRGFPSTQGERWIMGPIRRIMGRHILTMKGDQPRNCCTSFCSGSLLIGFPGSGPGPSTPSGMHEVTLEVILEYQLEHHPLRHQAEWKAIPSKIPQCRSTCWEGTPPA